MKRNANLKIAALVLFLFTMCLPLACQSSLPDAGGLSAASRGSAALDRPSSRSSGGRRRGQPPPPPLLCREKEPSFAISSRCQGFLTLLNRKVVVQQSGLNAHHPAAEFVKESCTIDNGGSLLLLDELPQHYVRYRHFQTNKYICFNKRGRVRSVDARRVNLKGHMCLFHEDRVASRRRSSAEGSLSSSSLSVYHRIRSAYNKRWFLGFSSLSRSRSYSMPDGGNHRVSLPRPGDRSRPATCGYHFYSHTFAGVGGSSLAGGERRWQKQGGGGSRGKQRHRGNNNKRRKQQQQQHEAAIDELSAFGRHRESSVAARVQHSTEAKFNGVRDLINSLHGGKIAEEKEGSRGRTGGREMVNTENKDKLSKAAKQTSDNNNNYNNDNIDSSNSDYFGDAVGRNKLFGSGDNQSDAGGSERGPHYSSSSANRTLSSSARHRQFTKEDSDLLVKNNDDINIVNSYDDSSSSTWGVGGDEWPQGFRLPGGDHRDDVRLQHEMVTAFNNKNRGGGRRIRHWKHKRPRPSRQQKNRIRRDGADRSRPPKMNHRRRQSLSATASHTVR